MEFIPSAALPAGVMPAGGLNPNDLAAVMEVPETAFQRGRDLSFLGSVRRANAEVSAEASAYRPIRGLQLRELLDEGFQRSYRYEAISNVLHDVRDFFRNMVGRDEDLTDPSVHLRR